MIFLVNERAMFEFVVTEATLREVKARNDRAYTQWVYDVQDTWIVQSAGASRSVREAGSFDVIPPSH